MGRYVVGVDLGGTNVRVVLEDETGKDCAYQSERTRAEEGPSAVINQIAELVSSVASEANVDLSRIKGLGIGLPGVIDSEMGIAVTLPNLLGWRDIPVAGHLHDILGLQVYCENDARMAAWGEKLLGSGRNYQDVIYLSIGTGIGSGIFLGGRLWRGYLGSAGEIGHMTIEKDGLLCSCGNKGCLEMYASGRGIARRARMSAGTVYEAAVAGDRTAINLVHETAEYLGLALANLANILNPEVFILGGGVSGGWGDMLIKPLREVVEQRAMSLNRQVKILQAQLGERAGVLGAAELVRAKLSS